MRPNSIYADAVRSYEPGLPKLNHHADMDLKLSWFQDALKLVRGYSARLNEKILDFGCGGGHFCVALWSKGFDAEGVDIFEYWGSDKALLGELGPDLNLEERLLLHKIDVQSNRLPYGDGSVDVILSDQTMEHVFEYRPIFYEQSRVLKVGGVAIHRFPHRFTLREPHTKVFFTPLTRFRWYLMLLAFLGVKNERQMHMSPTEVLRCNIALLRTTNYVSESYMLRQAAGLNLDAYFMDGLGISKGRAGQLYQAFLKARMGWLVRPLISLVQDNRVLVFIKLAK